MLKELNEIKTNLQKISKKDETLFKNEWLEVRKLDDWYTYWTNPKCESGIIVLVFDQSKNLVLGRYEYTPCHASEHKLTSITGGVEKGETPIYSAVREVKEETGIHDIEEKDLIDLGWYWPVKNSDHKVYMFALKYDSTKKLGEIVGDGTKGEEGASVKWISPSELIEKSYSAGIGCLFSKLKVKGIDLF